MGRRKFVTVISTRSEEDEFEVLDDAREELVKAGWKPPAGK